MAADGEGVLSEETANRMSLFYASHTPVMNTLVSATSQFAGNNTVGVGLENVCSALAVLATSCCDMLRNATFESPATNLFCLRAMTASIILYDQLSSAGAFHKKSPLNVRACVVQLQTWPDAQERASLANMLRFNTRHLKDDSTPAALAELLDAVAAGGSLANSNN